MLELNCSYEESKKILELGYDFSYICYEYQEDEHSYPCRSHPSEVPEGIPIIPKVALEACLPDRLQIETQKLGYTEIEECYPGKELGYGQYNYWYSSNGKPFNSRCFKDGVYEAFLWCHENYPEELKKKFEVMNCHQ